MSVLVLLMACEGVPVDGVGAFGGPRAEPTPASVDRRRRPLVARVTTAVVAGDLPLPVTFDAAQSRLGSGMVTYGWTFGDGSVGAGVSVVHTYRSEGSFDATLTLTDVRNGNVSTSTVTIDVTAAAACPTVRAPRALGVVDDGGLEELSGLVASLTEPDVFWVQEDSGNAPVLTALDPSGATLSSHTLPNAFSDWEDLATGLDPRTGDPMLYLADIGDNGFNRADVSIWGTPEPDAFANGGLSPLRMRLTYPDGPHNAETLLVDPLTADLFVVTKVDRGDASVFVKRAPHVAGQFVFQALGSFPSLALTATGGDVSADGGWIVVRDYSSTALLFPRDAGLPFEAAFDGAPCELPIAAEPQGEAIGFTPDGRGVVTVSEGVRPSLNLVTW